MKRKPEHRDKHGEYYVTMEAEIRVMYLQDKEHQKPRESWTTFSPRTSRRNQSSDPLISDFWPSDLWENISAILSHLTYSNLLWQPQGSNISSWPKSMWDPAACLSPLDKGCQTHFHGMGTSASRLPSKGWM